MRRVTTKPADCAAWQLRHTVLCWERGVDEHVICNACMYWLCVFWTMRPCGAEWVGEWHSASSDWSPSRANDVSREAEITIVLSVHPARCNRRRSIPDRTEKRWKDERNEKRKRLTSLCSWHLVVFYAWVALCMIHCCRYYMVCSWQFIVAATQKLGAKARIKGG